MKVLLITNLYPSSLDMDKDKNTKAIHDIFKLWETEVRVLRPTFLPNRLISYISDKAAFGKELILDGVKISKVPTWKIPKTKIYFHTPLINFIKKEDYIPDIVIAHRLHNAQGAYKLACHINKPLVVGMHKSDILQLKDKKNVDYFFPLFDKASLIACRSKSILEEFIGIYPSMTSKCFIAFSGVEKEIIITKKEIDYKINDWKQKKRPIKFITVAALKKLKNIDINLEALANLPAYIDWEYSIVGSGKQLTYLRDIAEKLGIEKRVKFLGQLERNEVLFHLKSSDIFIMVSAPETFGLVYIEAMASGCIVIGAYNNGIDGVIKNGENGFLCRARNSKELSSLLNSIYETPINHLLHLSDQSYNTILDYTEDNASSNYFEHIQYIRN